MKPEQYNKIAEDYHNKRKYPWRDLQNYINALDPLVRNELLKGTCLDLGCGNGRNFKIFKSKENRLVGLDNSIEFIEIAKNRIENFSPKSQNTIDLIVSDMNNLPFRRNTLKNIFSIASLHHVRGKATRKKLVSQIYKILISEGYFFLTLWRRWQKRFRKYFLIDYMKLKLVPSYKKSQKKVGLLEFGDKFIPWTVPKDNITIRRFYHFFSKKEAESLLENFAIKSLDFEGGPNNKDNLFILTKKP
ncbi:MAG: class I SAM-dependent methyltransferase [Promethearchaeota archaeon]|nr:MAG: class I SAM-dependent methyltransferase [Candidatus Lokiarchaeota archaeon]